MIRFQGKYLRTLAQFRATLDIRLYLNTILVEPQPDGGAVLVACNGHILVAIRDAKATCSEATLFSPDKGAISAAIKSPRYGSHWVDVNPYTQRLSVRLRTETRAVIHESEVYAQAGAAVIAGADKFPKWSNVIPKFSDLKRGSVDALQGRLLRKIIDAHPSIDAGVGSVMLWQQEKDKQVIVQFNGFPEVIAVIMPMRDVALEPAHFWAQNFPQLAMKEAA